MARYITKKKKEYKRRKGGNWAYNTKIWWCMRKHPAMKEAGYPLGLTIEQYCIGMRSMGYGMSWGNGQKMMKDGCHTVNKAKEISDMLFNYYKVYIPYLDLMGYVEDDWKQTLVDENLDEI